MSIDIKEDSLKSSTLERYSMISNLLSKMNDLTDDESTDFDKLSTKEEIETAFNEIFSNLLDNNPAAYFQTMKVISDSIPILNSYIIQSIDIKCFDLLLEAIDTFKSNEECLYITFYCISEFLIIENFRIYFFSKNIFQISLDAFYSDSEKISFYSLKIICAMIEIAFKNSFQFDIGKLLDKLEIDIYKSLRHEYFVVSILRSIVEFSDFSIHYEKIIDILCNITIDETTSETLNEVGETVYSILNQNFNYFFHMYYRAGIVGILLEQLNENTIQTYDIHFAIPILRIILCVINNFKDSQPDKAIHFAKSISYKKYEELIRNSTIELSELALEAISYLLKFERENYLEFERVMANFIAEAPFTKKHLGIKFFLSASDDMDDIQNLDLLLNLNIIENCSFCLDSDECDVLNNFLMIILNLLKISLKDQTKIFIKKIVEDISKIDLFNRAHQNIENSTKKDEFEEFAIQNLDKIDEIIQTNGI